MSYLLNIIVRPASDPDTLFSKDRMHTLDLRSKEEWNDKASDGKVEDKTFNRFIYEIDVSGRTGLLSTVIRNLRDEERQVILFAFNKHSHLIPFGNTVDEGKELEQVSFSVFENKDGDLDGFFNDDYLLALLDMQKSDFVRNKFFTIHINKPPEQKDTEKQPANLLSLQTSDSNHHVKADFNKSAEYPDLLQENDFNLYFKIVYTTPAGNVFYDFLMVTVNPSNRTWYMSLDFGSEASQFILRNSTMTDYFPVEETEEDKANKTMASVGIIQGLYRLLRGKELSVNEREAILQFESEDTTLYNSIFPLLLNPPIYEVLNDGAGGTDRPKPYELKLNRLDAQNKSLIELISDSQQLDSRRTFLPNLKVLKQLNVFESINQKRNLDPEWDPVTKDIDDFLRSVATTLNIRNSRGQISAGFLTSTFLTYYYRDVLNHIVLAIITQISDRWCSINNYGKGGHNYYENSINMVIRVLMPNMFRTEDIQQFLQFIQHDTFFYRRAVITYLDKLEAEPREESEEVPDADVMKAIRKTVNAINTIEVAFLAEGDAAGITVNQLINENVVRNYKEFALIDCGKGTTDISIISADRKRPASEYRTGFAGAGNFLTYHYAIAFFIELFDFVEYSPLNLLKFKDDDLAAYTQQVERLIQSEKLAVDPFSEIKLLEKDSQLLKCVHPRVLEKLISDFGKMSVEKITFAKLIDTLKISQSIKDEGATTGINELLKTLLWYGILKPQGQTYIYDDFFNFATSPLFGRITDALALLKKKKFVFTSQRAINYLERSYEKLGEQIKDLLVTALASEKIATKENEFFVFLSGRGSLDKRLQNVLKDKITAKFPGLQFLEAADLGIDKAPSKLAKSIAVGGAVKKVIKLNYMSNLSGVLREVETGSAVKIFGFSFGKNKSNNAPVIKKISNKSPQKSDFYFKYIIDSSSTDTAVKGLELNGYKCWVGDNENNGGRVYFTNRGYILVSTTVNTRSKLLTMDFSEPVAPKTDKTSDFKALVNMAKNSLFPLVSEKEFFSAIQEHFKQRNNATTKKDA